VHVSSAGVPPRRSRRSTAELRAAPSLEALMQLLVARAKLLLSLRSVVQAQRQEQVPWGGFTLKHALQDPVECSQAWLLCRHMACACGC
jgi:hypothetical protein